MQRTLPRNGCSPELESLKGYHPLRFRTAFGDIALRSPHACGCEGKPTKATFSPLTATLTTHTAPELDFLQSKWAAHLSFAAVADLLHDVLPVDVDLHADTVRQHLFAPAERWKTNSGPKNITTPISVKRKLRPLQSLARRSPSDLTAATFEVGSARPGATNCFEVLACKSIPQEGDAKVFALVRRVDQKPKRRLHEVLQILNTFSTDFTSRSESSSSRRRPAVFARIAPASRRRKSFLNLSELNGFFGTAT